MFYLAIWGLGYFVLLSIFVACPLIGKLILLGLNAFIPDPLPYIDEIVMIGSTAGNIFGVFSKLESLFDFIWEHKFISFIIGAIVFIVVKSYFFN